MHAVDMYRVIELTVLGSTSKPVMCTFPGIVWEHLHAAYTHLHIYNKKQQMYDKNENCINGTEKCTTGKHL